MNAMGDGTAAQGAAVAPADRPTDSRWPEIRAWRRATRAELIGARVRLARLEREQRAAAVLDRLATELPSIEGGVVGFYWASPAESAVRGLGGPLRARGAGAAGRGGAPRATPLEFWAWQPRMKMARGVWNIPIPGERVPVQPDLLIVPLVGFDGAGYRLGYGGGYYDRTLAALAPRPRCIGIGFELGRLDSIRPQPHDIPMDAIVTEERAFRRGDGLSP